MIGSACPQAQGCSHSITRRLSKRLALLVMAVLAALSLSSWFSIHMMIVERNGMELERRTAMLEQVVDAEWRQGGERAVVARLQASRSLRSDGRLQLWHPDGRLLVDDGAPAHFADSKHLRVHDFRVATPALGGQVLRARWTGDFSEDAEMGTRWAWALLLVTLGVGALVAGGVAMTVRRQLAPVRDLAAQTKAISPQQLSQRLVLSDPAEELRPWLDQFNGLMDRLERAYTQLEAFNADVAHELRTPLAALIGHTELALSRERDAHSLRETLASNLEELLRLSAMVNDMLFLASADRGVQARRGAPVSLAGLAREVVEFHEAALDEAGLQVHIEGDATVAVDEPLIRRALSNLIGNATRYALRGSPLAVRIAQDGGEQVRIEVDNAGPPIEPQIEGRIFDRFVRGDTVRTCTRESEDRTPLHHGLGLAIVAAIARMHAGQPVAGSADGRTRVGFTVAAA